MTEDLVGFTAKQYYRQTVTYICFSFNIHWAEGLDSASNIFFHNKIFFIQLLVCTSSTE